MICDYIYLAPSWHQRKFRLLQVITLCIAKIMGKYIKKNTINIKSEKKIKGNLLPTVIRIMKENENKWEDESINL